MQTAPRNVLDELYLRPDREEADLARACSGDAEPVAEVDSLTARDVGDWLPQHPGSSA